MKVWYFFFYIFNIFLFLETKHMVTKLSSVYIYFNIH